MENISSTSKERQEQPPLLFARAAQGIYNTPQRAHEFADSLRDKLHLHYEYMREIATEDAIDKARYLELRGPWNALLTLIVHAIEIELLKELRPYRYEDDPSVLLPAGEYDRLLLNTRKDDAFAAIHILEFWVTHVTEWFIEEVRADPNHWCRPVFEAFCAYHPLFREIESTQKEGWKRRADPLDAILEASLDSNITAYAAVRPLAEHHEQYDVAWERCDQTEQLLERVKELSWAASVTRKFLGDHLGREEEGQISKGCPFASPDLDRLWALPSLENGPWPIHRYCPASPTLIPPAKEDRIFVRQALNDQSDNIYTFDPFYEGISSAEMRLNTLIRIMGKIALKKYVPFCHVPLGAGLVEGPTRGAPNQPKTVYEPFSSYVLTGDCSHNEKTVVGA